MDEGADDAKCKERGKKDSRSEGMINLDSIKLIIWDLDETFWSGTLSEGEVFLPEENIDLIKDLTDCGIVNSICSKNDFEQVKTFLQAKEGVWEFFVFPSINWDSKGPQIVDKLDKMALRSINVLFIDDNPSNLGEVKHYLPEIQVGDSTLIGELRRQVLSLEKNDIQHARLKKYKILENREEESRTFASNEDFLYYSQIQVAVLHDCLNQICRIHELLWRSNQLNFTKKRISIEELESIIEDPNYACGYITVQDRFGDYGLVGFYALKGGRLDHFFFSCRTMGQKIEQWVYARLGFPEIKVVGEVRTQLNQSECPGWIHERSHPEKVVDSCRASLSGTNDRIKILLKGRCDLSHAQVYLKDAGLFDSEFDYVNEKNGQVIEAYNHSVHIEGLYTYSEEQKEQIAQDCIFVDPAMLNGGFFSNQYDIIFLSTLVESSRWIYRKKGSDLRVVFGGFDLTNPDNWDGYIKGDLYNGNNAFSKEYLSLFSQKYESLGRTTPGMYISFLNKCLKWLPDKTVLCLILGATTVFEGNKNVRNHHRVLNEAIKSFSTINPRIKYIEIDDCIHDSSDFMGGIDHFSARVYYEMSQKMIQVIQQVSGVEIKTYAKRIITWDSCVLRIRNIIKRYFAQDTVFFRGMKRVYNAVYKHRND